VLAGGQGRCAPLRGSPGGLPLTAPAPGEDRLLRRNSRRPSSGPTCEAAPGTVRGTGAVHVSSSVTRCHPPTGTELSPGYRNLT
jgi:hypothetical protein